MEIIFKESSVSLLNEYVLLYEKCFPNAHHFSFSYLEWLYVKNPVGCAVGADAFWNGVLIGQVIAIPNEYYFNQQYLKGLLAVNVVVHPDFQGRQLFKKLGLKMCEYGKLQGYEFVIGVANAAATPGWIRHMGFQLVTPLTAKIGVGQLNINDVNYSSAAFYHNWSAKALSWRLQNPVNVVSLKTNQRGHLCVSASAGKLNISAYCEIVNDKIKLENLQTSTILESFTPKIFLGLVPNYRFPVSYVNIPEKLKPSPLNFIFKSLVDDSIKLDKNKCFINFLDFDAF